MRFVILAALALGCLLTAGGPLRAATIVINFPPAEDYIFPDLLGSQPGVSLAYRHRAQPGNTGLAGDGFLRASSRRYGDLDGVARTTANGTVGEVRFTVDPGYLLSIDSLQAAGGFGNDRPTEFRIYDDLYTLLWTTGAVIAPGSGHLDVRPGYSRAGSLILQWGPDSFGVGIDQLTYTLTAAAATPGTAVPEPGSLVLLGAGLGLLRLARRGAPPAG